MRSVESYWTNPDVVAREDIQKAVREQWLKIATVKENSALLRVLTLQLHRGEAETIALAVDLNAGLVLIDEQEGRQVAAKAGFAVTGALGILLRAKRSGEIPAVKPEIDLLRSKAHFFVSSALETAILRAAGE